jgi:single-strand selective monofunctional uracil DNA glycosylase
VVGIGAFAEKSARRALAGFSDLNIGRITHPSPANPKANRGWAAATEAELDEMQIHLSL